ncbi:MAG: methyl-accepting chemotaxis protein, partial [Proteobacteria bacterium]|nr:methyl-accepting chemotaxis protein [Pseudomonadota bacterium]
MKTTYTRKSFFSRSIRNKLILILIAISFIPLAIVSGVAIAQLYAAKNAANEISENYLPSIINLNHAELDLMHIVEAQKNHIIAPDDITMKTLENDIKTYQETLSNALIGFEKTLDVGEETEAFEKFNQVLDNFLRLNEQVILFSQTNDDDKAQALSVGKANDVFQEAFDLMQVMLETNIIGSENAKSMADTAFKTGSLLILVMSIISAMVVIIVAVLIANYIAKPIIVITEAARSLATDDATLTGINTAKLAKIIVREDEIGDIGRAYDTLANYFKALSEDFVQVSQGLAVGNLNITPKAEYKGDFVKVKDALEASLSNLQLVINDIVQISQGLAVGNLKVMPKAKYNGDFAQIKEGLETTLF